MGGVVLAPEISGEICYPLALWPNWQKQPSVAFFAIENEIF